MSVKAGAGIFTAMNEGRFSPDKRTILRQVFGFDDFRAGQEEVIDRLLGGGHALAVMPTGSGKSLCFQVPALVRGGLTIVVSPLVALMQDQVAALRLAGVAAETINSARERPDNVASWRRVAAGETRLLYLAPERLMTERMLAALKSLPVRLIAIDEAHCISQWGPAFRPEYELLSRLKEHFPGVPIAALTATADEMTRRDIQDKLFDGRARAFVTGFDRPNIHLAVERKEGWQKRMFDFLEKHAGESGIVYCLSRRKTNEVANLLSLKGFKALPYHAGMEREERTHNQDRFITESDIIMVATIAFGMGIDKPDIRFVLHLDIPGGPEAYYQEIGRAGRDGAPAEALLLYGLDDLRMRRMFIEEEDSDQARNRREHKRLDALVSYCEAPACRRQVLLDYFGEEGAPCGNCDLCHNPVPLSEGSELGRQVLQAVEETGNLYGQAHIVEVLRGANTEKIRKTGHDNLATYGSGKALDQKAWRSIIRQMVAAGFLNIDIEGYGGLKVTAQGRALMAGEASFLYRQDLVARTASKKSKRASLAKSFDLNGEQQKLLAELKALRLSLAKARGVPPYVIFADRSLIEMAAMKPRDREQFATIHGVGAAKLKDLAEPFLEAIVQSD